MPLEPDAHKATRAAWVFITAMRSRRELLLPQVVHMRDQPRTGPVPSQRLAGPFTAFDAKHGENISCVI